MSDYHATAIQEILARLEGNRALAAAASRLAGHAPTIARELAQAVVADVPQYSTSRNPDILPEAAHHAAAHVDEILRLLQGGAVMPFEFVREHARRRAEQRFPLEATLHAYRCGHKVLSRWLRDAMSGATATAEQLRRDSITVAEFTIEYTDAISTTFASAYSARTVQLADVAGDQRAELLRQLLAGYDEADAGVARLLREAGFPNRPMVFCVAVARSVDPAEMLNAARARRLTESIEELMGESPVRRIIDVHANKVTMVFADARRDSGWTAPRSSLAQRISQTLGFVGNAALIGVSNDVPSIAHIPTAYREASAALAMADMAQRVVVFAGIAMERLLLYFARDELQRVLPAWATEFHAADQRAGGALSATLRAYADSDMNVLRAAGSLGVHANTVYARFQRIQAISGLSPGSYRALSALLIVAECKGQALLAPSG